MNDPWDVKSVRKSEQYVSCMRISGAPLLPPILSRECRKEMQYYKLLAKEVEKRIAMLKPYVNTSSESDDETDAPELPEFEQNYELPQAVLSGFNVAIEKIRAVPTKTADTSCKLKNTSDEHVDSTKSASPTLVIDLSLSINEKGKNIIDTVQKATTPPPKEISDLPERDYNCKITRKIITEKEVITEIERCHTKKNANFSPKISGASASDPLTGITAAQDGPSSLSSKSFTGSLNDLHSESIKDSQIESNKLVRQRSYTLLQPSPQLLKHLETQALNAGIEMNSISMSESLSNISTPSKKRRSWDLESAKVKWSKMAMELKQKTVISSINKTNVTKTIAKPLPKRNLIRGKTVDYPPTKRNPTISKPLPKSEPIPNTKRALSPEIRNNSSIRSETRPVTPEREERNVDLTSSPKQSSEPIETHFNTPIVPTPVSESEDPATRVRELYEKIQKQQLVQMASLVEKQKREQLLLQQVFEEQNNLLFKQLKTICPKSPIEAKEAWSDKHSEGDRGPVSLSQLINFQSPGQSTSPSPSIRSPVPTTLIDTNNCIDHCDNMLKKSRVISGSIKKHHVSRQNCTKLQSPRTQPPTDGSVTRTHSPAPSNSSICRKLNYDTTGSSERDFEPILTDRTNDTMADLNVTFPSDNSEGAHSPNSYNNNIISYACSKESSREQSANSTVHSRNINTDNAIKSMERTIHNSMKNSSPRSKKLQPFKKQPTAAERAAAAKIVALVKGYLVRRLMRTERVQGTVQTIKDALLCALQLHQDREGIRGADVDLHRRLIQQITAACYALHDTFITSTPAERCALIATDRGRRRSLAARQLSNSFRQTDLMSQSHSGSFPARANRQPPSLMTQSNYETFSSDKSSLSRRYMASPRRRPWR